MAEHDGVGAGRSFYETASAEVQSEKYSELREALEQIKSETSIPFSEDWWNDQRIWGGPITIDSSGQITVGEASKLSKVLGLLNITQMAFSSGLYPGLSVQQVGLNYQPLIIVDDQPTTALALWEDNLPVMSLNGAASVPMPMPVGQMAIAYNSDPNGVHYPIGVGALPWESFVAYSASTLGLSIDTNEVNDSVLGEIKEAISDAFVPVVFDENGQVYALGNVFNNLKTFYEEKGYLRRYSEIETETSISTLYLAPSRVITSDIKTPSGVAPGYHKNEYTFRGNAIIIKQPGSAEGYYNFLVGGMSSGEAISIRYLECDRSTGELTGNVLGTASLGFDSGGSYGGDPIYTATLPVGILSTLPCPVTYNGYNSGISIETRHSLIYGDVIEPVHEDGITFWNGNGVDYTQGGIEIITNPDIDHEPEVQPYYPMYIPDPYTNPGKTVSPEVNPNPHSPSEFPNITPFIQPQIDPEVLPEKEKEEKTTRELTLPFPTVLPINDPSSVADPTKDPSQLDWPLPDTPEPPPTPPAPPKPSGITPDIGVPDPALWPTIIPDHSISGQGAPGLIHVYNPTPQQFVDFGRWLWVTYADATIDKIWNNPFDGVISAHELYYTPTTGAVQNIRSGFLVSTASAAVVPVRYTNINCGTMIIPEYWANYLDYSPYSKAHVYLPFIGIVELDVDDIVGHAVNITYAVDAYNGSCIAQITVAKSNYQNTVYQFSGNCSVEVPLSGGSQAALKSAMLTAGAYGLTSVVAGIMGSVGTAMSGAYGALGSLLNPISQKSSVQHSGSFGASHGAMGIKKPFIIIRRPIQKIVNNYNAEYGFPAHKAVLVGNCTGYLRVREVNVISATATNEEKAKIEELLKEGVYVT